jgi:methylase of polypeptide subunit release factors
MRVRDVLIDVDLTPLGLAEALGAPAVAAIARDRYEPARRALRDRRDEVSTLIRLLHLGDPQPLADLVATGLPVADLVDAGLVEVRSDQVMPLVRVEPLEVGGTAAWVVADFRRTRPLPADHVLGLGGAASTLSGITVREAAVSALDLGTGGGVQLLHLARHAEHLVGTDVSERALRLARMTLALNEIEAELRIGDRYEPVTGEVFDLIVSNPPMVIGSGDRFTYRDAGLDGDAMSASVIAGSARHLSEGGRCQLLAHWLHVRGQDWRERVAGWLPDRVHALVVQREALDPAAYVEMWLADGGDVGTADYARRYDTWMQWFDDRGIEAVGLGWAAIQRTESAVATVRLEDVRQGLDQPLGPAIATALASWEWSGRTADADVLDVMFSVAAGVVLDQRAEAGDGWTPGRPVLVQTDGLRRSAPTDPFGAFVVGRCDGRSPLRDVLSQAAGAYDLEVDDIAEGAVEAVRGLVENGFLVPNGAAPAAPDPTLV